MPLALVGTFAVMFVLGYSLDNLSLMALTIAVGFVVDDAIVMLENIYRYIEEGMNPMDAALRGAGEIGFTIISISVSLIAVFIPLLLMGGIVGRLFREFAMTVSHCRGRVRLHLADADADDVLALPQAPSRRAWPAVSRGRGRVRRTDRLLPPHAGHRAPVPLHHLDGVPRHPGRHRLPVRDHPQGLLPAAGHRRDHWDHRGCAGYLVPGDGAAARWRWARSSGQTRTSRPTRPPSAPA